MPENILSGAKTYILNQWLDVTAFSSYLIDLAKKGNRCASTHVPCPGPRTRHELTVAIDSRRTASHGPLWP